MHTYKVRRSTGERFHEADDTYNVTGEQIGFDVELNVRGTPQEQFDQLNRAYDAWVASGKAEAVFVPPSDGLNVDLRIDTSRRPSFDVQTTYMRDGRPTADTLLDRVVFGEPIIGRGHVADASHPRGLAAPQRRVWPGRDRSGRDATTTSASP